MEFPSISLPMTLEEQATTLLYLRLQPHLQNTVDAHARVLDILRSVLPRVVEVAQEEVSRGELAEV